MGSDTHVYASANPSRARLPPLQEPPRAAQPGLRAAGRFRPPGIARAGRHRLLDPMEEAGRLRLPDPAGAAPEEAIQDARRFRANGHTRILEDLFGVPLYTPAACRSCSTSSG